MIETEILCKNDFHHFRGGKRCDCGRTKPPVIISQEYVASMISAILDRESRLNMLISILHLATGAVREGNRWCCTEICNERRTGEHSTKCNIVSHALDVASEPFTPPSPVDILTAMAGENLGLKPVPPGTPSAL